MNTTFIQFVNDQMTDDDYRSQVVRIALDHRKRASGQRVSRLKDEIKRLGVRVKGFPKRPEDAPTALLIEHVVLRSRVRTALFAAVLDMWTEAQSVLKAEMSSYLQANGLIGTDADPIAKRTLDQLSDEELRDIAEQFCSAPVDGQDRTDPKHQTYDDILMLYCILGQVPRSDDEEDNEDLTANTTDPLSLPEQAEALNPISLEMQNQEEGEQVLAPAPGQTNVDEHASEVPRASLWASWLTQLEALAPADEAWNSFSNYVVAAQTIADRKQQERETSRDVLRSTLETLRSRLESRAEYFGFVGYDTWSADQCALTDVQQRAQQIAALDEALVGYIDIEARPVRTWQEKLERNAAVESLGQEIVRLFQELSHAFARSEAPATNGPSPDIDEGPLISALLADEDLPVEPIDEESPPTVDDVSDAILDAPTAQVMNVASDEVEASALDDEPDTREFDSGRVDHTSEARALDDTTLDLVDPPAPDKEQAGEPDHMPPNVEADRIEDEIAATDSPPDVPPDKRDEDPIAEQAQIESFTADETIVPAMAESEPPLAGAVADQLGEWLASWQDLPKADLLATWLSGNEPQTAAGFPSRGLYDIAYYAFQPHDDSTPLQSPPLAPLEAALAHAASPGLAAAAWQVAAGLVILRGEVSLLDMLHVYDISPDSQLAPWHGFARATTRYASQTDVTLPAAARRISEMQHRPDPATLAVAARQALERLTKSGRFPFKAGRDLVARIDRDLARLSRVLTSRSIQTTNNEMTLLEAAKWARELKPASELQRWARATGWTDNLATRTNLQELEVDLRALQRAVVLWTAAALPLTEDLTLRAFTELSDTVAEHGEAWRTEWAQHKPTMPALVAWSGLLLERVFETIGSTAYAEESQK